MFSKFEGGVNDAKSSGIIYLPTLVNKIQNNPKKKLIELITLLRSQRNVRYKELKRKYFFLSYLFITYLNLHQ